METFPSEVYGIPTAPGFKFPDDGTGLVLVYPDPATGFGSRRFPAVLTQDPASAFPTLIPEPEKLVYAFVLQATQWRLRFPEELANGVHLPNSFSQAPGLAAPFAQIPVVRGWPAFPGDLPAIGVALGSESEDTGEDAITGGFVGDCVLKDREQNPLAWASYYSEPLYTTTVVELVHENRDERDRLHSEMRRILFPLRRLLPNQEPLIRRVQVDAEKQEIANDELPMTVYCSVFTVHVWAEMLVPGDVAVNANVEAVEITLVPVVVPLKRSDFPDWHDD
jgi:hypothetical protein